MRLRVVESKGNKATLQSKMNSCHSSDSGSDDNGSMSETCESLARSEINAVLMINFGA